MTTASCGDYPLLTPPSTDCHRVRPGPVTAMLYEDYVDSAPMPLHHRGPYNLTCYMPTDLRHHHQQQHPSSSSTSSYPFSRTPSVVDRSQSSTFHHDARQTTAGSTAAGSVSADHGGQYASQRCDPSGYPTVDDPYSYAGAGGRCLSGIGGVPRPMRVTAEPDAGVYSTYGGGGRCMQTGSASSSSHGDLLMRTMTAGCCVSGYCSPTGPCHCDRLYEHDPVTLNGNGHITGEHVSCRLQHQQQQQQHPHQSAGTYKWMTIKRSTPKMASSGVYQSL